MHQPIHLSQTGSLRSVALLAWPMVIGMLSYTIIDVTDTLMVGWLGKTELAAVGVSTSLVMLLNAFFIGFFESVKILVAQATGAEQDQIAKYGVWQGIWVAIPAGLLLPLLVFVDQDIFRAFGTPEHIIPLACDYFEIRIWASPFWFIALAVNNFYQGIGDTKTPMFVNIFICIVNVFFCLVLIHGLGPFPKLGVKGAALATVFADFAGMLICCWILVRRTSLIPRLVPTIFRKLLNVGWPIGIRWLLDIGSWTAFTILIAQMGENELAANQIVVKIMMVSLLPGYGIGEAACVLAGQRRGAGDFEGVTRSYKNALLLSFIVMGILGVSFFVYSETLVWIFLDDPDVLQLGTVLLMYVAVYQLIDSCQITTAAALNGAGDTHFTMIVSIVGTWFVTLPLAYYLSIIQDLKAPGIWLAIIFQGALATLLYLWRFKSGAWKSKAIIEHT